MTPLQISFDAFRAKIFFFERKILPRLEPDYLFIAYLLLNTALLATKTAMCLYEILGFAAMLPPAWGLIIQMGPELFRELFYCRGQFCHAVILRRVFRLERLPD